MLKTTYILFVIYITAINAFERKGYPDYKYKEQVGGWMKLHEKPANWKTAVETCKKEGAVLVASQYDEVDDTIVKIAKESNEDIEYLFIGTQTLSGTTPPKQEGEVVNDTKGDVNCIVLVTSNATKKSVDCNNEYPFVCYAPRIEVEDCDFSGAGEDREGFPGYHRCNETGGWVKIHPGPNDYDEAKKTCEEEGGELVDPDDPKFKEIALKLIKSKGSDGNPIYGKTRITHPHGGFVEKNGRMVYVKNLPPYCTLLFPNGTIDHRVGCDQKVGFICHVPFPEEPIITTTTAKPDEVKEDGCGTGQEKEDNPGYKKCKDVDGWVKVHPGPNDQDEARKTCLNEGGELIDPSDPKFKEIVLKLTKNNPITIFGKTRKPRPDGDGFTKEGGKTKFGKKTQDFCTVVYPNGTLDDEVSCDEKAGFICYIPFEDDNICTGAERQGYEGYKGCPDVDGWVKVHPGPNDFDEAKEICEQDGGELIDLNDPLLKKIALQLIKQNRTSVFSKNRKTSDGSGFSKVGGKTKFMQKDKEFCSILYPDGTIDDEVDCNKKVGFVCYVHYPLVFSCGDGGYIYDESTENCYKVNSIGKTWAESRKQCQVDGGDLVIIKREKEVTALQDIYAKHDQEYIVNHPTHMWAGILQDSQDTWATVEAETLDAAGYNVWARDKPSKKQENDQTLSCGAVNMKVKYVDCACELKHGYICQKKVTVSRMSYSTIQHGLLNLDLDVNLDLGLGIFRAPARIHL